MKEIILGVLAVGAIVLTIAFKRAADRKNINGMCSVECIDCCEKDWCIFRYRQEELI